MLPCVQNLGIHHVVNFIKNGDPLGVAQHGSPVYEANAAPTDLELLPQLQLNGKYIHQCKLTIHCAVELSSALEGTRRMRSLPHGIAVPALTSFIATDIIFQYFTLPDYSLPVSSPYSQLVFKHKVAGNVCLYLVVWKQPDLKASFK